MKVVVRIFAGLLIFGALYFGLGYLGVFGIKFWGVKNQNARREVFEQSQSFVEAKRQAITKYYDEFIAADPESKAAIQSLVKAEFANFDIDKFMPQQKNWYFEIVSYCRY